MYPHLRSSGIVGKNSNGSREKNGGTLGAETDDFLQSFVALMALENYTRQLRTLGIFRKQPRSHMLFHLPLRNNLSEQHSLEIPKMSVFTCKWHFNGFPFSK